MCMSLARLKSSITNPSSDVGYFDLSELRYSIQPFQSKFPLGPASEGGSNIIIIFSLVPSADCNRFSVIDLAALDLKSPIAK